MTGLNVLTTETLIPILTSAGLLLTLAIPSLLCYGYLADRVTFGGEGRVRREWFGRWDVLVGGVLAIFFASVIVSGFFGPAHDPAAGAESLPSTKLIVLSAVETEIIFLSIVAGIILVLKVGGFSWLTSLGLRPYPVLRVVGWAVILLLMAYPLIAVVLQVWRLLIASVGYVDDSQQDAVRFLAESKSQTARMVVAAQAVLFAPLQEELIFRGCLYGLAKRYFGSAVGVVLTSFLFAGIHLHLPSFAGLFILAVCLTLAYEWTGSIFVPIAMHALFNLLSVIALFR